MSVQLFPHNQIAYNSALEMLESCGKAAIVHPTGTGKSFIGFKLCEEKKNDTICWLSPSEYIFKTQIENLKKAGGNEPTNICFYTYAKLMLMSEEEMSAINPNYIVLDEFHRCGAEMWGEGVQRLLRIFSNARILGLSATAIRYLDNQRDMVAELFDGNVASEITLGEAIVKGILNPPKYVLSVFSCQKDLEKYEARVKRTKAKVVRDAATVYLDALRRTLEKAEGLEEIFYKHKEGLKAAGEWHQLKPLFPSLEGKSVLDLGCGYGWHCKFAEEQGATKILGIDLSKKMIEEAQKRNSGNQIEYRISGLEEYDYPENEWDCVISNLALHYIEDIVEIFQKVYRTLKPGGIFLFNIEHPVFTAGVGQDWIYTDDGKPQYWAIDNYFITGERNTHFLGCDVVKQHHTLTQIIMGLLNNGFELKVVEEAEPPKEMMDIPGMEDELRRPMMLLVKAIAKK